MEGNGQEERIAFELEFDPKSGNVRWRTNPKFPIEKLVHGLDLAHAMFLDVEKANIMAAQQQAQQRSIVMPDGSVPLH